MVRPRPQYGECGDGAVPHLFPNPRDLEAVRSGAMNLDTYREQYLERMRTHYREGALRPGRLRAIATGSNRLGAALVQDGDTLCCACSKAKALAGACHRVWAATALAHSGWRVVLDGEVVVVD